MFKVSFEEKGWKKFKSTRNLESFKFTKKPFIYQFMLLLKRALAFYIISKLGSSKVRLSIPGRAPPLYVFFFRLEYLLYIVTEIGN